MSEDILSRIAGWCEAANDLGMEDGKVTVAGDPPIEIAVDAGEEAVTLGHTHPVDAPHEGYADLAMALLGGRGSMLEGDVATDSDGTRVEIRYPIYLDGLNRQTFLLAVRDITATADGLNKLSGGEAGAEEPAAEDPAAEEPAAEATAEQAAATTATAETVVVDPAGAWAPTHTVPGGGMSAWAEPDPGLAPVAKLAARVELQVDEQRGAWAKVTGSNGWTGWVDARKLRPLGAAAPAAAPQAAVAAGTAAVAASGRAASGRLSIRLAPFIGGLAMLIGSLPFLKWIPTSNFDVSSFDVGMGWLWRGSLANPRLGLIMVILAAAAIVLAVMPRAPQVAFIAIGVLGAVVTALFTYQVVTVLAGSQWKVLFDGGIGIGWWIAFIGSLITLLPLTQKIDL